MVKPGYSQTTDIGVADAQFRRAADVVEQLQGGAQVAPQAVAQAGHALVDSLWRGQAVHLAAAQDGLSLLIPRMSDVGDQAQALGEVIAAGTNARPVLDGLAARGADAVSVAGLSPLEMQSLKDQLASPPQELLATIADLLQAEAPASSQAPASRAPAANPAPRAEALPPRQFSMEDAVEEDPSPSGTGPDGDGPASIMSAPQGAPSGDSMDVLMDGSVDSSVRVNAAMAMGSMAIAPLVRMLRGNNGDEKELAFVALTRLGADAGTEREVRDQMRVLEGEPDARPTAECIRRGIESGGAWSGQQRHLAEQANVSDGWLSRAIASCDRPGILSAAAGREVYAIPLALRQVASLRSKRPAQRR